MKRIATLAASALLLCATASAVPAKPGLTAFTQSDGTTVQVQTLGDEFHHSLATADRLTVERGSDGDFYYRTSAGMTTVRAHDAGSRTAAEQAFLAAHQGECTMAALEQAMQAGGVQRARRAASAPQRATQVPTNGSPRVPIILVQYSDKKMSNTRAQFEAHYKTGAKSVYAYFTDQSNDKYTPQFDIYGIYTLDYSRATYGANDSRGYDKGLGRMVEQAITKAGNEIDWSLYDNNGDGEADVCIVVYAGVGEAQASTTVPSSIWPCQWDLASAAAYGYGDIGAMTRNGVTINKFAVFNEVNGSSDSGSTLDGVGTFCHEFSHCLGLPDFYETTYSNGYYGMGNWSLMNSGCYNGVTIDGDTPIGYSAYEKSFMNWIDLVTPQSNTQYTLPVFNSGSVETDLALKITGLNANEYWILENRRQQGWDLCIPDEGVLITHFTYVSDRWDDNTVNNKAVQLATVIPADNSLTTASEYRDLFGESNHSFTSTTTPAMKANMTAAGTLASSTGGAGAVNKPVTEIYLNSDGTAALWYDKGNVPGLSAPVLAAATNVTPNGFTASWTHAATTGVSNTFTLSVTQGSTTVQQLTGLTGNSVAVTGLNPSTTYTFRVKAVPADATQATESSWSTARTVTTAEAIVPTLAVSPSGVAMGDVLVGQNATATFALTGRYLEGDVTLELADDDGVFAIDTEAVAANADGSVSKAVTVTFAPTADRDYSATVIARSSNATDVVVPLAGTGYYNAPQLLPADTTMVNHTAFRAQWTDDTPQANVASYTLQVDYVAPVTGPQLLEEADFTGLTAVNGTRGQKTDVSSSYANYLPAGWTCTSPLYIDNGAIQIGNTVTTAGYTIPDGYDKLSVVLTGKRYNARYGTTATVTVGTSRGDTKSLSLGATETTQTCVFDAQGTMQVTLTGGSSRPDVSRVLIYAGDVTAAADAPLLAAIEVGDSTTRTITGITAKFCDVTALLGGGTFNYKVKAIYASGNESVWSAVEQVTLRDQDDTPAIGDVNGDGQVDVDDVNILINIALGNDSPDNYTGVADIDGDGTIDVTDVNMLINIILSN